MSTGFSAEALAQRDRLAAFDGPPLTFMEVCGTHTMAVAKAGLKSLFPKNIRLISGPGCPVCVTPVEFVDHTLALTEVPDLIVATFGDLVRVPGSAPKEAVTQPPSLMRAKACGADVRVVYSPLDALRLAAENPTHEIVFLGVGFETTAPGIAATILKARDDGTSNFTVLCAHKTVPEAMAVLASSEELGLNGFLCPGHASIIIGSEVYEPLAHEHGVPCAIAGFEPVEILRGINALVSQAVEGRPRVDNCYRGVVKPEGNQKALALMRRVFEQADTVWRGLGTIPQSGLAIRDEYGAFDAARRFDVSLPEPVEPRGCRCGDVLRGLIDPVECPLFGGACTPENPRGACMVSSEGSCAASYTYGSEGV